VPELQVGDAISLHKHPESDNCSTNTSVSLMYTWYIDTSDSEHTYYHSPHELGISLGAAKIIANIRKSPHFSSKEKWGDKAMSTNERDISQRTV